MTVEPDVLIVGAGPAGLSAAHTLQRLGMENVVVVDREPHAGGIPLLCPHPTFGLTDFYRPMTGQAYATRLRSKVDPAWLQCNSTVISIGLGLETRLSTPAGLTVLRPKRLLLATGIRETPRSARLVSGDRPRNVLTTGALQRLLAVSHRLPFENPLIVGTELVAFSALLSLRDAGVKAVAMLEQGKRIVARRPADLFARFVLKTPILYECRVARINAMAQDASRLASVTLERVDGTTDNIACDAIIFTGSFVPEASLIGDRPALFDRGSRGPAIDQFWRLGQDGLYAAGNVLRSVETAAWCAREGRLAAEIIAADHFGGSQPGNCRVKISVDDPVAFSTPSFVADTGRASSTAAISVKMAKAVTGRFTMSADERTVWRSSRTSVRPERRIVLSVALPDLAIVRTLKLGFETGGNG